MDLGAYLKEQTARRWQAGVVDCCTLPGDWVVSWGRGDPMAEWRGRYSTDDEARALIDAAGGLVALWQRGLASIGIGEVGDRLLGDVGVIQAVGIGGEPEDVGAIWAGKRWGFRCGAGMAFASANALAVWGRR